MTGATDIHVHLFGACPALGNAWQPDWRMRWIAAPYLRAFRLPEGAPGSEAADLAAAAEVVRQVRASRVRCAVLLALDAPHDDRGHPDAARLRIRIDNAFARRAAAQDPSRLRFGASIHPYRADALDRLIACARNGAALVKWLPSYQNIRLDDPRCMAFYEALAQHRLPLLVHTGFEHTLSGRAQDLNHPRHLVHPLRRGVTVIAAHCGARMYLHEPCWCAAWAGLAAHHEQCYGDIGAFGSPVRLRILRRLLARPEVRRKLVFGSDFPARSVWARLGLPGGRSPPPAATRLDQTLSVYEAAGVPTDVLARGGDLLAPVPEVGACA